MKTCFPLIRDGLTEGYEALRGQATGRQSGRVFAEASTWSGAFLPRGMSLLLGSGLPAWIAMWTHLVSAPLPLVPRPHHEDPAPSTCHGTALAVVLADMALNSLRRCEA